MQEEIILEKLKERLENFCEWARNNKNEEIKNQTEKVEELSSKIYGMHLLNNMKLSEFKEFEIISFEKLLKVYDLFYLLIKERKLDVNINNFFQKLLWVNLNYEALINSEINYKQINTNGKILNSIHPLKMIRIAFDMKQKEIAPLFSLTNGCYNMAEKGTYNIPIPKLNQGLEKLGISLQDYLDLYFFCEQISNTNMENIEKYRFALIKTIGIINIEFQNEVDNQLKHQKL